MDAGIMLTLCRYEPNREFPVHAHELPGLYFLLCGDHEESDGIRTFRQRPTAGVWHDRGFAHGTRVGPRGMTGLNISVSEEARKELNVSCRIFDGALCSFLGLRIYAAVRLGLSSNEMEDRVWELLAITSAGESGTWLDRVHQRVREDFRGPLRLSVLASEAGVHPVYLARSYRQRFGHSISDELHALRLGCALSLVAEGMTRGEAALEAGFSDQSHMTRLCRRYLGMNPKALSA